MGTIRLLTLGSMRFGTIGDLGKRIYYSEDHSTFFARAQQQGLRSFSSLSLRRPHVPERVRESRIFFGYRFKVSATARDITIAYCVSHFSKKTVKSSLGSSVRSVDPAEEAPETRDGRALPVDRAVLLEHCGSENRILSL